MSVPTPHNGASKGDFAKTVLMPGDPLRAKFIAENFLTDAVLVNNVRGIHGYTGFWENTPVSVMASGMGIPSISIYSYELFNFYGVENIIRIGSAGGLADNLALHDIVAGIGACTDSNFAAQYSLPGTYCPTASYKLLSLVVDIAAEKGLPLTVGNLLSSDAFYNSRQDALTRWKDMGVLAVEMEAAGLYMNAAKAGKNALAICTISDHVFTGEALDAAERQTGFVKMIELALTAAARLG